MFKLLRLLALLMLVTPVTNANAQREVKRSAPFELLEVLVIGADENAPIEYLFSNPRHIRTDSGGRIYVAEQRAKQIRVFDANGGFIKTLGREGGGPGEFADIQAMGITPAAEVLVYDRAHRRFTRFPPLDPTTAFSDPSREEIETFRTAEEYYFIHTLSDGRSILLHQPRLQNYSSRQDRLHVYDNSFNKIDSFGASEEWRFSDDVFSQQLLKTPFLFGGSHVAPGKDTLIIAPKLYRGVLYRYFEESEDGPWVMQQVYGQDPEHPTHEVVQYERGDDFTSIVLSGGIGASYRSVSHGVGQLDDGRIVHLSSSENSDGVRRLQLELFTSSGNLTKVGWIKGFEAGKTEVDLRWIDRENQIYLIDRSLGFPVLRIMKLNN